MRTAAGARHRVRFLIEIISVALLFRHANEFGYFGYRRYEHGSEAEQQRRVDDDRLCVIVVESPGFVGIFYT